MYTLKHIMADEFSCVGKFCQSGKPAKTWWQKLTKTTQDKIYGWQILYVKST
jgi:hypothetical protein